MPGTIGRHNSIASNFQAIDRARIHPQRSSHPFQLNSLNKLLLQIIGSTSRLSSTEDDSKAYIVKFAISQLTLIAHRTTRPSCPTQLHQLSQAQHSLPQPIQSITNDFLPTFITPLASSDSHQGLVSKRKISILYFILALASLFHAGLIFIAASYDGPDILLSQSTDVLDDWPRVWVQTKVASIDGFHVLLSLLIDDLFST